MSILSDIELYTNVTIRSYIDSRDLIKAREEAEELLADDDEKLDELDENVTARLDAGFDQGIVAAEYDLLTDDERDDLKAIIDTVAELDGCAEDWSYGATLIPEQEWQEYVEEYACDTGAIERDANWRWPFNHIDWEAAAFDLSQDYTTVEIDGTTYYVR